MTRSSNSFCSVSKKKMEQKERGEREREKSGHGEGAGLFVSSQTPFSQCRYDAVGTHARLISYNNAVLPHFLRLPATFSYLIGIFFFFHPTCLRQRASGRGKDYRTR